MDNNFFENPMIAISDGRIENITRDGNTTLVTVSYQDCINCNRRNETVRLAIGRNTRILDEFGNTIPPFALEEDMTVNATFSSAMTRSIPPQSNAFMIQIIERPVSNNIAVGRIIEINRAQRQFTLIRNGNLSSAIRFNVPMNAKIFDIFGRPTNFSSLIPGLRVQVRHASFMTASIPPQTTALEIRMIR